MSKGKPLDDAGQEAAMQQVARIVARVGGKRASTRNALYRRADQIIDDMPLCTCGRPPESVTVAMHDAVANVREFVARVAAPRFKVGDYVRYVSDNSAAFRVAAVAHDDPLPYRIERATNRDSAGTSWAWTFDAAIVPLTRAELIAHKLPPYGPGALFLTDVYLQNGVGLTRCRFCERGVHYQYATCQGQANGLRWACDCDGARAHGTPVTP